MPASTPDMLDVFNDTATVHHALAFESCLAQAHAAAGVISPQSAEAITQACSTLNLDMAALAQSVSLAGTLAIPLVRALRARLTGAAARDLHRGATSQDVADSVLMRQVKEAAALLAVDNERLFFALEEVARRHATRPAVGRTLLQDARPIGFGLRIAQWLAGIREAATELQRSVALQAKVQLGGAAGTRAGMEGRGAAIARDLAQRLQLAPSTPWHARRGGIAGIAANLGIYIGALGKMARDISLLAQNRIGEALEPAIEGRGGSSIMSHKRNPTACQIALSAAIRAPGLVATVLTSLPAEQERGLGGWQAEGPALTDLFLLAAGSVRAMVAVAQGLVLVDEAIADNLADARIGGDIGESEQILMEILNDERGKN
jgi:3-carboxy-cis,cis-muconate cycloisomerase